MGIVQAVNLGTLYTMEPSMVQKEMRNVERILLGADGIDVLNGDWGGMPCRSLVLNIAGWPQVVVAIPVEKCGQIADALAGVTQSGLEVVRDLDEWFKAGG
jgi:hypothetical protein